MHIIRDNNDILDGLEALEALDPRLKSIIESAGEVPLRLQAPGFEGLASIIVSQMISRAAAGQIWQRLQASIGEMTADRLLTKSEAVLREAGLSGAKARTLLAAANAVSAGELDLERICLLHPDEAQRALIAVKGVGPWTADIYLMFCAGHSDIFPTGDVALQNAVAHALELGNRPKGPELAEIAALWSPWRAVAARLFWAYYSRRMKRETNVFG